MSLSDVAGTNVDYNFMLFCVSFMPPQYAPQAGQQPPQPAQQQAEQTEDEMIAEAIRRSLQDM